MSVQVKGSGTIGGLDEGLVVSGIVTSSTQINVGSNIKIGNAGVVTATSFSGAFDASNLTGTVADARISSLTASKLTGALPAIDGSNLTGISAGTSLSGSTNNTVCTVTGANAIQGESGLTYDGTVLNISNDIPQLYLTDTNSNNSYGRVRGNGGNLVLSADHNNASALSTIVFESDGSEKARIDNYGTLRIGNVVTTEATSSNTKRIALGAKGSLFGWTSGNINGAITMSDNYYWDGANNKAIENDYSAYLTLRSGNLRFGTTNQTHSAGGNISGGIHEKFRIETNGNATINDGNLVIGTSGHGIDFSATGDGTGSSSRSELLDDYESGEWTGSINSGSANINNPWYVKIGKMVIGGGSITSISDTSSSNSIIVNGLPFSNSGGNSGSGAVAASKNNKFDRMVRCYVSGTTVRFMVSSLSTGSHDYLRHSSVVQSSGSITFGFNYQTS